MPAPSPKSLLDGVSVIRKGMNSGVAPRLVSQDAVSFACNVTFRGGLPRTRPVWKKVPLTYTDATTQTRATQGLFQGAGFHESYGGNQNCLISTIGGRVFRYLPGSTNGVDEVSIATDLNNPLRDQTWMWQAEDFLIINDGQAYPLFWDGASLRRSKGQAGNELPAGCMGAYVQGRIYQATPDRRSFIAGDLVYSHGYGGPYSGRDAVLQTTENTLISGGGVFGLPANAGQINAMSAVAMPDTSLGQGPLQVFTMTMVFSVQVPLERTDWAIVAYPLMTIGLPNYGSVSQNATTPINGDIWTRTIEVDGIRSYQISRRDFSQQWVNTPLAVEMERALLMDSTNLLRFASAQFFDNRYLLTCSPYSVQGRGTAHRGMVALDFNNVSTLLERSTPAYDGLWTGLPILQIVKGVFNNVERLFAFALDCNNDICLYELLKDGQGYFDNNGTTDVGVESWIETRAMSATGNGNVLELLKCADLYLDRLAGNNYVQFDFKYRSDEDPIWVDWHDFELCAPVKDCSTAGCPTFQNVREQYRTYLRLPEPSDTCSQITKRRKRTGYEFQVRMWAKGFWQLNRLHVWLEPMPDSVVKVCPDSESCTLLTGCDLPMFDYSLLQCP